MATLALAATALSLALPGLVGALAARVRQRDALLVPATPLAAQPLA